MPVDQLAKLIRVLVMQASAGLPDLLDDVDPVDAGLGVRR
jgi:hypothetical protein